MRQEESERSRSTTAAETEEVKGDMLSLGVCAPPCSRFSIACFNDAESQYLPRGTSVYRTSYIALRAPIDRKPHAQAISLAIDDKRWAIT